MSKHLLSIIIISLISLALGYWLGSAGFINKEKTFEAGWQAAQKRLAETGFLPPLEEEVKIVNGQVKEIKDKQIVLKIQPLEPLADPDLDTRIVEVDDQTKIYQQTEKSAEQYQKEMADYEKKVKTEAGPAEAEPIAPPDIFVKTEADFGSIKAGQWLMVTAQENIKEKKQFKAVEIVIQ